MEQTLLQQFRQQLATWIDRRMETQRLPFQRLEICPRLLTKQGRQAPDLVLWINRDSQLAGSMIILPDTIDSLLLEKSVAMAQALGLGNFTTWAAREVIIWQITNDAPTPLHRFALPPANRIVPDDFQNTLTALLEKLKIVSVNTALSAPEFTLHYYANLCLRNLQELTPGLTVSARLAAGQTAADDWLELAPMEKAWMSLWRVLFLIWKKHLPPGLQPERLEQVMCYALADFISSNARLACLEIRNNEPPLQDQEAVRLHHLASRLRQLGWPRSRNQAIELVDILLSEISFRYGLSLPQLPWTTNDTTLWVNCTPVDTSAAGALVVPRAGHAGWALHAALAESSPPRVYAENLFSILPENRHASACAVFNNSQILDHKDRESHLIRLRQAWPNRRFDLPKKTPVWLWEALFLSGQTSVQMSLVLPRGWYKAPGVEVLWSIFNEHYQLTDITGYETGRQALRWIRSAGIKDDIRVHLADTMFRISQLSANGTPGTLQIWINAPAEIREMLRDRSFAVAGTQWAVWTESIKWGSYLFLQTRLGRYLWDLCSDQAELPGLEETEQAVLSHGMLLPDESCLASLSLSGSRIAGEKPDTKTLEREFMNIFGVTPEIPQTNSEPVTEQPRARRRDKKQIEGIIKTVFVDGVPRFPEHYLMNTYRPELVPYQLYGPLEVAGEFFDRIFLYSPEAAQKIEVSGRLVAEALILASHSGRTEVELPKDEKLLQSLLERYRADLEFLWDKLIKECRRIEPHRQSAIRLAQKIWRLQELPPTAADK